MITEPVTYAPSIRRRLIRVGVPVLIFLLTITAYVLLNAETFERNADPDSISIPAFIILIWVSVSGLAFVPLLVIGGTQLVVAPNGFAFGGRLKGAYLKAEGRWRDVIAAEYKGGIMRTGSVFVPWSIFGLRVRQPSGDQFISLHHYRDQLRAGGRLAEHLRQVAPQVYAAIEQALTTRASVQIADARGSAVSANHTQSWAEAAAQARQAGDLRAEVQIYQRAIESQPRDHHLYFYLASALIQSGQPDEALAVMQQGLWVRPTSSALAFNIARTARSIGRQGEADAYFELALSLAPEDPDLADRHDFVRQVRAELEQT